MRNLLLRKILEKKPEQDFVTIYTIGLVATALLLLLVLTLTSASAHAEPTAAASELSVTASTESQADAPTPFQMKMKMKQKKQSLVGQDVQPFESMLGRVIKGFFYCLAVLIVIFSLYKRFAAPAALEEAVIKVISKRSMGSRNSLILLSVRDHELLVTESADGIRLVAEIGDKFDFTTSLDNVGSAQIAEINTGRSSTRVHG